MKRCVIIGGADIADYAAVRGYLRPDDFFVFCDGGLRHAEPLGVRVDLIVGDFDSHARPDTDTEVIELPREKDDTDTFFAAKEAVRRGFSDFLLLGVSGGRLDHTFGNISVMLMLDSLGKNALLVDDYSEMEIVSSRPKRIDGSFPYFSVMSLCGTARGVNIKNAKFPLSDGVIEPEYQYGISNEPLPGRTAEVSVGQGRLLLIKVMRG